MLNTKIKYRPFSLRLLLKAILIPIVIIILIIFLILPIEVPYSFTVPGKVMAVEEYLIIKGNGGQLMTQLRNNRTGVINSYSVTEFERGDNPKFIINPDINTGEIISIGDTIGSIISNELEYRLTSLKGQLNVAYSLLNSSLTGEKESLVKAAEDKIDFATRKADLDRKIFLRQQKLFEKELISQEEFEISKNTLEMDDIAVEIAKAELQTVLTGQKKEQIELMRSQIKSLEKEISVLENKFASFNLTSPINGYVRWTPGGDTLLIISDSSQYVVSLSIPLIKKNYIGSKAGVYIIQPHTSDYVSATLERINNNVEYYFSKPVVLASAIVAGHKGNLTEGLIVECKVDCGKVKISEYIKRIFNSELF